MVYSICFLPPAFLSQLEGLMTMAQKRSTGPPIQLRNGHRQLTDDTDPERAGQCSVSSSERRAVFNHSVGLYTEMR